MAGDRTLAVSGFFDAVVGREGSGFALSWYWHVTGPGTEYIDQMALANGGDVLVPIFATRAITLKNDSNTNASLGCDCTQILLARFSPSGELLASKTLVAGMDPIFSVPQQLRLTVDRNQLVLSGAVYGAVAVFGTSPNFFEYQTTQFYSTGGGEIGSGGDGFVARYDAAGSFIGMESFRPIEFGAAWTGGVLQDDMFWVVGGASERAFVGRGEDEILLNGTALAAYRGDGTLSVATDSTGGEPTYGSSYGPLIAASIDGSLYVASTNANAVDAGFGTARKTVTGTYVERLNSRGGFLCRERQ